MIQLLHLLESWALVSLIIQGFKLCYALIQSADADTERERKERCRDAAERFELASDFPAGFRVGSLANPWPAYEGPAYFALVDDLAPTEAGRR